MYHGILVINKPVGMTSHDVVFKLRKILRTKRIGHTGTLDPNVAGVLVCCIGQATKLVEDLMDGQKGYWGEITLGFSTETEDADGAPVERKRLEAPVSDAAIDAAMATFLGEIVQIPPYYSAVKVGGKRLYEYARAGQQVERPRRIARIDRFERLGASEFDPHEGLQRWSFDVQCGKGTYVRTLAVDLGAKLGYPSHMSHLVRYMTGGYSLSQAHSLEEVAQAADQGRVSHILVPLDQAINFCPHYHLQDSEWTIVKNGQVVPSTAFNLALKEATACYYQGKVRAIYGPHPSKPGMVKPLKMFTYEEESR